MKLLGLLLVYTLPAAALAQFTYPTSFGDIYYETNNNTITLVGYSGSDTNLTIPNTISVNGVALPVTIIGEYTFADEGSTNSTLTSITIGTNVVDIGDNAFESSSLTNLLIPDSVTNIGNSAFNDCEDLTSITLGQGFISIGDYAFNTCLSLTNVAMGNAINIGDEAFGFCTNLTNFTFDDSVTNVGNGVFMGCSSLTDVTISKSVATIGDDMFLGCTNLMTITVDPLNPIYSSLDGVMLNKGQTTLVQFPRGRLGGYVIPGYITSIGDESFDYCSLTSVTIPDSVTNIGNVVFENSDNLTSLTIPDSVTTVGFTLFDYCSSLTNLVIGSNFTNIDVGSFQGCYSMTSVIVSAANPIYSSFGGVLFNKIMDTIVKCPPGKSGSYSIPAGVTTIGDYSFGDCISLTNVMIPQNIIRLNGVLVFEGCTSLKSITVDPLNSTFTSMDGALFNKSLTTIIQYPAGVVGSYTIPGSVTTINDLAFENCSLTSVIIPDSVTSINEWAFAEGAMTNVTIPDSVLNIGYCAFYVCPNLASITIGNNVTSIGSDAFFFCSNLSEIYFRGNPPYADSTSFGWDYNATVYSLPGTAGWDVFSTNTGIPTTPWLPQIQTSDTSIGTETNQFRFNIDWASGQTIVVEACTNLTNPIWIPLSTNTLTAGSSCFSDPQWTNYPGRYYRISSP